MRKAILLLFLAATAYAQSALFVASKNTSLTAAVEAVTVQQPAAGGKSVQFQSAYFDCSAACVITLERNGTAATTTALTISNFNPGEATVTATAFSASNVGVGTVIAKYNCTAACQQNIDLTGVVLQQGAGKTANLTLRTNSITATVDIVIRFREN